MADASHGYRAALGRRQLTPGLISSLRATTGSATYPAWGLSWTYDRYGNRTAQAVTAGTGPSNSVTVDPTTNRITDTGYSYDANGNMTNDGLNSLTYDAENRLVSSSGSSYTYDGNNLRVKKVSGGATTVYVFSGMKVIAEYANGAAPSSPTREYIYSGGALLATVAGSTTSYHQADHLSVRLTTDASGNVAGQQGHYPYGESWYASSSTTKWQFTSYERDAESGNDYAMARYYVNRLGRFCSADPLAGDTNDPQSLNRYAYVLNSPINLVDPLGQTPVECECVQVEEKQICRCARTISFNSRDFDTAGRILTTEMWDDFHIATYLGDIPVGGKPKKKDHCIPSVFNPSCKAPELPTCPEVFFTSMGEALAKFPAFPTGQSPEDAARAAAAAAAARHIINRGLVVALRSSIVRTFLFIGEASAAAAAGGPVIYSEFVGLKDEFVAWYAGTCRTIWSK